MAGEVKPIPDDRRGATPYICCKGAGEAIDFYTRAFGATELLRIAAPGGKIGHAEIRIGTAPIMLADEAPEHGFLSPAALGGSPVMLHLYVEDVDGFVRRAVDAGATLERPVADQFYGDRGGKLTDPFGHLWWIATRKEEVAPEELRRRAAELYGA